MCAQYCSLRKLPFPLPRLVSPHWLGRSQVHTAHWFTIIVLLKASGNLPTAIYLHGEVLPTNHLFLPFKTRKERFQRQHPYIQYTMNQYYVCHERSWGRVREAFKVIPLRRFIATKALYAWWVCTRMDNKWERKKKSRGSLEENQKTHLCLYA